MGFLIKKAVQQIVTAKVTLTSANLLTPGYIVDIPEYPAVKNYFWVVLNINGNIVNGATPYTSTSAIHIQASTVNLYQYRFGGTFMSQNTNSWGTATASGGGVNAIQYAQNDKLQIHNPGTLLLGDNDLNIYITAILLPL
jgi:hypothetical protein